jgi:hypothetical protein
MEGIQYGYARVLTGDQTTALQGAAVPKKRMQNDLQGRGPLGSHEQAPCPAPLTEETQAR